MCSSDLLFLDAATPAPPLEEGAEPAAATRMVDAREILVVDDEPGVRMVIAQILAAAGYAVREAESGAEALVALEQRAPDLMIADFAMPRMNGAELARRARARVPALRILMVSGHADPAEVETSPLDGPLLAKPFEADDLLAAVARVLDEVKAA